MEEYRDHSNRLSIDLSTENYQYSDLEKYEKIIHSEFKVKTIEKLDGLDQFYWDFDFGENILVLHLEHFTGISIHMSEKQNDERLRDIAKTIKEYITNHFS